MLLNPKTNYDMIKTKEKIMKLENFILLLPRALVATLLKVARANLSEEVNNYVVENGLYHIVPNEEIAKKIIDSGKIKASKNWINSYGTPVSCMFAGIPEVDNYLVNLGKNPLFHPEKIIQAVKINPYQHEMSNFKTRILQDRAILHEGDCIISQERTEIVQLVIDLKRNQQGKETLVLRERTKEEIEKMPDIYVPTKKCLQAIEEQKTEEGYVQNNFLGIPNAINTILRAGEIQQKYSITHTIDVIKTLINKIKNPQPKQIEENINSKIHRTIEDIEHGQITTKKSVRSKRYVDNIIELKKEGIKQENISKLLPEMVQTREVQYLRQKIETINQKPTPQYGIAGRKHNQRMALLSMIIASKENMQLDDRMLEILILASYCPNIANRLNIGNHAKLIKKLEMYHVNKEKYTKDDIKVLQAVIYAYEGSTKKMKKGMIKYKVSKQDIPMTNNLIQILREANTLDRVRLSSKGKMNWNPKYLKTRTAKSLINFSFELETLTRKVEDFSSILTYNRKEELEKQNQKPTNQFIQKLREQTILKPFEKGEKQEEYQDFQAEK